MVRQHQPHRQHPQRQNGQIGIIPRMNRPKPPQSIAQYHIGEAPQHIGAWAGQADARRLGERRLEFLARHALDEMGNGVAKKRAGEEVSDIGVPKHGGIPLAVTTPIYLIPESQ